ncbi:zinc-finger homeodomain protein 9-like [Triticum aestivum]|uniref:zinc-finger homeodomain protein 9-like n=1 Tax=Triticum aestivum TaxID=4565 RepID=UPI001D00C4CC|nr:zinc-finger homeodomain protein 9-like [Triticum aestivum]
MDIKYPKGFVKKVRQAIVALAVEGVKYKECSRNHALATSGQVVDGCGEWMPLGDLNPTDASSYNRPLGALQIQRLPAQLLPATAPPPHVVMSARKWSYTMFTTYQKMRMQELSKHLGWRLQKRDKDIIKARCHDIGISKDVFRNWRHNNKRN